MSSVTPKRPKRARRRSRLPGRTSPAASKSRPSESGRLHAAVDEEHADGLDPRKCPGPEVRQANSWPAEPHDVLRRLKVLANTGENQDNFEREIE